MNDTLTVVLTIAMVIGLVGVAISAWRLYRTAAELERDLLELQQRQIAFLKKLENWP